MALDLNNNQGTYVASEWKDQPDDYTPITPERLNHIEQGIQANSEDIKTLGDSVSRQLPINLLSTNEAIRIDLASYKQGTGYYIRLRFVENEAGTTYNQFHIEFTTSTATAYVSRYENDQRLILRQI